LGAITTIFSSLIGLFQQDIKKVIAYSTMSQLAQENFLFKIFRHQTICVKVTVKVNNSQITKAHDFLLKNHISVNLFNSSLIN
jgi:NADH:ubiquinone oxidoreductase subunit 4 (subunit M)